MSNPIQIRASIPHKFFNKATGGDEIENISYSIPIPKKLMELDPYIFNSLLTETFSLTFRLISLNSEWTNSCKSDQEIILKKLQHEFEKKTLKYQIALEKKRRTPKDVFLIMTHDPSKGQSRHLF